MYSYYSYSMYFYVIVGMQRTKCMHYASSVCAARASARVSALCNASTARPNAETMANNGAPRT